MKRVIQYILILFLSSCNDFFHEQELTNAKITSTAELEQAVNGVYAQFTSLFTNASGTGVIFFVSNVKADDLASTLYPRYEYYYDYNCDEVNDDDESIVGPWNKIYEIIASTNNIIKQFDLTNTRDKTERQLLGEAYFFRAYFYFWLTRTYGRIPLVKDIDINYNTTLADYEEIYEFIEADLKIALYILPLNNSEARIPFVTIHRGTAKAILAEVYLSWAGYPLKDDSKYAQAAKTAGEVIDSADYFGYNLEDDFARVWEEDNRYNLETILALYFSTPESTTLDNWYFNASPEINMCYTGFNAFFPQLFDIEADTSCIYLRYFPSEINFYNMYPKNYRRDITFFTTVYVPGYNVRDNPELDSMYVEVVANACARPAYRKFYYTSSVNILSYEWCMNTSMEKRFHGNTKVYLYRYAQTLLTYAEAMARSGQLTSKAYEAVNQIRRRAYQLKLLPIQLYKKVLGNWPVSPKVGGSTWSGWKELKNWNIFVIRMREDFPKLR